MTGLTPIQAERLHSMRVRRTRITGEVEVLGQCERRMTGIREKANKYILNFRKKSEINPPDWRGQKSTNYSENREQSEAIARNCTNQMNDAIQQLSNRRSVLSTEIVDLNANIAQLEQIERGGI